MFRKWREMDRLDRAERGTQGTWKKGKMKSEQNEKEGGKRRNMRCYKETGAIV